MNDLNLPREDNDEKWKTALHAEIITAITGNSIEKVQATNEVGYYYSCCAPAFLYKYYKPTPINIEAIMGNSMWYSAPCSFNDVFDCDVDIDEDSAFESILRMVPGNRQVRRGSQMWRELKGNLHRELRKIRSDFASLKETIGVSCLCESENSLLMWAHYADNHRGICVEYNLLEMNRQLDFTPIPVIYSNSKACFDSLNLETSEQDSLKLFIQSVTSKSPEWSYEQEWRIIRDNMACGDRWDDGKKGALLDMIRPNSIILGCQASEETRGVFEEYCKTSKVNLYKMKKDDSLYRLNKEMILGFDSD